MKKRVIILGGIILAFILIIFVYLQHPKTLGDLVKGSTPSEKCYLVYRTIDNGEWISERCKISDPQALEEIMDVLNNTEISFSKLVLSKNTDIKEGEVWYEVSDITNMKSIQIMDNGEVHCLFSFIYQIERVYEISEEDRQECVAVFNEIMDAYGSSIE